MKKVLQYISLLVIIAGSIYFLYHNSLNICQKKIKYSVGRFDSQFGLSKEQFIKYVTEAESVWEKSFGQDIFVYDYESDFKINLIYDERQLATIQKQKTEFGLSAVENIFKKLDSEFDLFKREYDERVSSYESSLSSYEARESSYNKEVVFWNNKGGAPKDKYEALEAERRYLNSEAQRLNIEAEAINDLTKELNTLLKGRNAKAIEYNKIAEEYNKKYNGGLEFNQAEYIKGESRLSFSGSDNDEQINVYQFGNSKDLVLALSHEFGHALGMGHVENPKSVMYYMSGTNTDRVLSLSTEDLAELKRVCK